MNDQPPKPPMPGQQQDMPGSSAAMHPRPDYGEDSYKGSGRLSGKRTIITGGDAASAARSPWPTLGRARTSLSATTTNTMTRKRRAVWSKQRAGAAC
jgi:hypothetical protein